MCPYVDRIANCRFDAHQSVTNHARLETSEVRQLCCNTCDRDLADCVGFSMQTTRTVVLDTNVTMRVAHTCIYLRDGRNLQTLSHARVPRDFTVGDTRRMTVSSDCYVSVASSPIPPAPSSEPSSPRAVSPPAVASPPDLRLSGGFHAWWFGWRDLDEDHRGSGVDQAPAPKVGGLVGADAFDRL